MKVTNNIGEATLPAVEPLYGFIKYLNDTLALDVPNLKRFAIDSVVGEQLSIRSIWESSDLSADEMADHLAAYFKHRRVMLADLLAAPPLVDRFTRRFLRETAIFPFDAGGGSIGLAVADPTDLAGQRGAQIVLGREPAIAVASFDDIAAVLAERLGPEDERPPPSA